MTDLFYMGGPLFMGILTLLLLAILAAAVYLGLQIAQHNVTHLTTFRHRLTYLKSMGLFTLVFGIFGQLLGLYQAFTAIEQVGSVSPALLAGGLKVSMISTLYGLVIFLISYILWFALDYLARQRSPQAQQAG